MLIISQSESINNLIGASGMLTVYKDEYVGFTFGGIPVYQASYPACNQPVGVGKSTPIKPEW